MHLGGRVVGQQGGFQLRVAAQRLAPGLQDPQRVVGGQAQPLVTGRRQRGQPLLAVAAGGDLAQHGVDQAGGAGADDGAREVDGGVHGRVRGHAQVEELVGAQPEEVEHPRVQLGERAGRRAGEDGVQGALRAQRPVGELGGERGVALVELPLAQQLRQQQVGVGGARRDAVQHVVGGRAGRRPRTGRRVAGCRGGGPAADRRLAAAGRVTRPPARRLPAARRGPVRRGQHALAGRLHLPEADGAAAGTRRGRRRRHHDLARPQLDGRAAARTGPSRSRSPRHVVQAPGAGVTPRIRRSTT